MDNDIALIEKHETDGSDERKLAMGLFGLSDDDDEEGKENADEIHKREEAE